MVFDPFRERTHAALGARGIRRRRTGPKRRPVGSRVNSITVAATGQPIDPGADYRVVTNDFMINGGDNYTTFQQGTHPVIYSDQLLSDVLVDYVRQFSPINQHIEGCISPQ